MLLRALFLVYFPLTLCVCHCVFLLQFSCLSPAGAASNKLSRTRRSCKRIMQQQQQRRQKMHACILVCVFLFSHAHRIRSHSKFSTQTSHIKRNTYKFLRITHTRTHKHHYQYQYLREAAIMKKLTPNRTHNVLPPPPLSSLLPHQSIQFTSMPIQIPIQIPMMPTLISKCLKSKSKFSNSSSTSILQILLLISILNCCLIQTSTQLNIPHSYAANHNTSINNLKQHQHQHQHQLNEMPTLNTAKNLIVQQQREHMHFKTSYACESNQLDINCAQEGKLIHVARAIYGRFSLSICNEFGHSNLSVQCAAYRAHLIMENKCNSLPNCSVIVSKDLFGDPCEGTSKYLEVQYYCYEAGQAQSSQAQSVSAAAPPTSPHQINPLQQVAAAAAAAAAAERTAAGSSISSTGATTNQVPTTPNHNHNHNSPSLSSAQPNVGGVSGGHHRSAYLAPATQSSNHHHHNNNNNNNNDFNNNNNNNDQQQTTTTTTVIQQQQAQATEQRFCQAQSSARNYYWNYTRTGQVARQSCPQGFSGQVSWLCDSVVVESSHSARFLPIQGPDFSQCSSIWLQKLHQQLMEALGASVKSEPAQDSPAVDNTNPNTITRARNSINTLNTIRLILNDLALMSETKELFSTDLRMIHSMLAQTILRLKLSPYLPLHLSTGAASPDSSAAKAPGDIPAVVSAEELFNKFAQIVSNLFDSNQRSAWLDLRKLNVMRKFEQNFLDYLKEAGAFLLTLNNNNNNNQDQLSPSASSQLFVSQTSNQAEQQQKLKLELSSSVRQKNLVASIVTVIMNNNNNQQPQVNSAAQLALDSMDVNQELTIFAKHLLAAGAADQAYNLQQQQQEAQADSSSATLDGSAGAQMSELRLSVALLRELLATGVTRFLLLEVKKPDYQLMQLELQQQQQQQQLDNSNNLFVVSSSSSEWNQQQQQQRDWSSRVFGVFPLVEAQLNQQAQMDSGTTPAIGGKWSSSASASAGGSRVPVSGQQLRPGKNLNELLAQWPISIDFKLPTAGSSLAAGSPLLKQCSSLSSAETSDIGLTTNNNNNNNIVNQHQQNRCQTFRSNSTNYICRCDKFGFMSFGSSKAALVAPSTGSYQQSGNQPILVPSSSSSSSTTSSFSDPFNSWSLSPDGSTSGGNYDNSDFTNQQTTSPQQTLEGNQLDGLTSGATQWRQQQQQYIVPNNNFNNGMANSKQWSNSSSQGGIWTSILIVMGLSILVVALAAFLINTIWRASAASQCKLDKKKNNNTNNNNNNKQSCFFASSGSSSRLPTTGPMPMSDNCAADLMAASEPIIGGSNSSSQTTTTTTTTANDHHSTAGSLFGLSSPYQVGGGSIGGGGYKSHNQQQLYAAAHLPPLEVCGSLSAAAAAGGGAPWSSRAIYWLRRPTRWLRHFFAGSSDSQHSSSSMIQHRIIGSSITNPSSLSTFKSSQYQNGYTTSLHHHHPHHPHHQPNHHLQQMSAHPNHLVHLQQHQQPPTHLQQAHLQQQQHHLNQSAANANASLLPLAALSSSTSSYVSSSAYYEEIGPTNQHQPQQQHQLTTNVATTPRHYLFASPSAVNGYKSTLVQQQQHHQPLNNYHHPSNFMQT